MWGKILSVAGCSVLLACCFYDLILDKFTTIDGPYVFLRSNNVNGRLGPSKDYPCVCVYSRQFLPMRCVSSQGEWLLLQDWQGLQSWVHKSLCSRRRRYVLNLKESCAVYTSQDVKSTQIASLAKYVCVEVLRQNDQWLRVKLTVPDQRVYKGWLQKSCVWGAQN